MPHLVLDSEATIGPESCGNERYLAQLATPSVLLLGYDARQPSSSAAFPFGVDNETM
jgi:hypothetical protein